MGSQRVRAIPRFCLGDDAHFDHSGTRRSVFQMETTGHIQTRSSSSRKSMLLSPHRAQRGKIDSSQFRFAKSECLNSTPSSSLLKVATTPGAGICAYVGSVAAVGQYCGPFHLFRPEIEFLFADWVPLISITLSNTRFLHFPHMHSHLPLRWRELL